MKCFFDVNAPDYWVKVSSIYRFRSYAFIDTCVDRLVVRLTHPVGFRSCRTTKCDQNEIVVTYGNPTKFSDHP